MYGAAQETLLASLKALQISGEFSDLKIFCGGRIFHVHKAIVCTRSPYFETACKWGKEGELKNEVDLTDDEDPRLVKLMVDYFYQLDYDDWLPKEPNPAAMSDAEPGEGGLNDVMAETTTNANTFDELVLGTAPLTESESRTGFYAHVLDGQDSWGPTWSTSKKNNNKKKKKSSRRKHLAEAQGDAEIERLVVNTLMYALADKFGITDLKVLAMNKFIHAAGDGWQTKAFIRAADLVFTTTPSSDQGLRSVVVETIAAHHELIDYTEAADLLNSGNGIAWKLLLHSWKGTVEDY